MMILFTRRVRAFISAFLLVTLLGCSTSASARKRIRRKAKPNAKVEMTQAAVVGTLAQLIQKGEQLLGRPYRYRGVSGWVLDCSGYVGYLYSTLGVKIPRSSSGLSAYTQRVQDPQPGDLLFFKGRNSRSSRVGHVALVVDSNNGDPIIMHSTNSRGIIKHPLSSNAYFRKRYLHAGRLPGVEHILKSNGDTATIAPIQVNMDSVARAN